MKLRLARGFTLIEMLVVIAIITLLFTLAGVIATRARAKARTSKCKAIIKRTQVALEAYKMIWRDFPSGAPAHPDTWPSPYDTRGVEFDIRFVTERDPGGTSFTQDETDPADRNYLIDPWGKRIRYRKVSPRRMLVWSSGPDGVDDIGAGVEERKNDDISVADVDY